MSPLGVPISGFPDFPRFSALCFHKARAVPNPRPDQPTVERLRGLVPLPLGRGLPATLPGWSEPLSHRRPPVPSGTEASLSDYAPNATEALSRRNTGAHVVSGSPLTRRWRRCDRQFLTSPCATRPGLRATSRDRFAPLSKIGILEGSLARWRMGRAPTRHPASRAPHLE